MKTLPHLVLSQSPPLEVELHQLLVVLGDALHELIVQRFSLLAILVFDLADFGRTLTARKRELLHEQHVDN